MARFFLFFLILNGLFAFSAWGEVRWAESPLWRSARVLPQGQHRWSARVGGQVVKGRFNEVGEEASLGQPYEQKWTWGDLLRAQRNKAGQTDLRQYMKENDITENDQAAVSGFDIEREELNFDMSWAIGMTSRWMFGLVVPISQVTTRVSSRVSVDQKTSNQFKVFSTKNNSENKNVEKMVKGLVKEEIDRQGYKEVPSERRQWVWGDVSLLSQLLLYSSPDMKWSFQQVLRMPTSRNPSLSDFAQASRDEGQVDIGVSQLLEREMGRFTGIFGLGYMSQLPGPVRVSQPNSTGESLQDIEIERDLGDVWWSGFETRYRLSPRFLLSGAYRYFYKGEDKYKFTQQTTQGDQQAHLARFVTSYLFSTGETRYEIEKKWLLSFQVQTTLAGVNSDRSTSAAVELQTYF